jgi:hypothetical protein
VGAARQAWFEDAERVSVIADGDLHMSVVRPCPPALAVLVRRVADSGHAMAAPFGFDGQRM